LNPEAISIFQLTTRAQQLPRSKMPTYQEFRDLGDQWIISYACTISGMPLPTLFTVGHCLEAYCKSAILKNNPSIDVYTRGYGHDIENMIFEIQREIGILQSIQFYPNVEANYMIGGLVPMTSLQNLDYQHFIPNQELYWVAKFQKDIKYLGTSGKRCQLNSLYS
jgi:hypothetical protein